MKKRTIFTMSLAGMIVQGAFAVTITKDPTHVASSILIEDFNSGTTDPSSITNHSFHDLDFESIGGGVAQYSFTSNALECWTYFVPQTTHDPSMYPSIRMRMNSVRSPGELGHVDIYASPIQGAGRVVISYPNDTDHSLLREASWNLPSVATPYDGAEVRVDPFNYTSANVGTDYWNVDYIRADIAPSRGAEFDSQTETNRFGLNDIGSTLASNSIFSGTSTGTDSQIQLHTGIGINADTYSYVEVRLKTSPGTEIKWFWQGAGGIVGVVLEHAVSNDGEWHTYFLDMTDEVDWTGSLTFNRLDPVADSGLSFEVDYVRFLSAIPPNPLFGYEAWAAGWGVDIGAEIEDPDSDGFSNLYEFGLDGDPTNAFDQGTSPTFGVAEVGGSNVFGYVHPQRSDPNSGLTYSLALATDLVAGNWSTNIGYAIVGTNVTGGTLNFITNATDTVESQKYIRLIIE